MIGNLSEGSSGEKKADDELFEGALPLRLTSVVVRGYGRGSTDLGIPTANLSREEIKFNLVDASFDDLPTGMYSWTCYCVSVVLREPRTTLRYDTVVNTSNCSLLFVIRQGYTGDFVVLVQTQQFSRQPVV